MLEQAPAFLKINRLKLLTERAEGRLMHSHPEVVKETKYEQQRARVQSASEKLSAWLQREARPCIGACKVKQALTIVSASFKKKKDAHSHRSARTYTHTGQEMTADFCALFVF